MEETYEVWGSDVGEDVDFLSACFWRRVILELIANV
jgi:hypothetical protein